MTDLSSRVVKGAAWGSVATVVRIASSILVLPVLARFLDARDFGLVQMGMPIVLFLMLFSDVGLGPALVRADSPSRKLWSSAFWTNIVIAGVLSALVIGTAPFAAVLYEEPDVEPILQVLGALLLLQSLSIVPYAWLQREMYFERIAIIEMIANVLAMALAIITAARGAGAWALIYQQLALYVVKTVLLWRVARPPLGLEFNWLEIKAVIPFAMNLLSAQIVNFLGRNADNVLIGKFLGATLLGFYSLAYRLMLLPVQVFSWGLAGTLLPALSRFKHDIPRLKAASLRIFRLIAFATFPIMAGMAALSEPLVEIVLGQKMASVAPLLAILAPVGALQSISSLHGPIYMAVGRTDILFRWSAFANAVAIAAFFGGVYWGIEGVAIAYLIVNLVLGLPGNMILLRLIDGTLGDLFKALGPAGAVSIVMGLTVYALAGVLTGLGWSDFSLLLVCVPVGGLMYFAGAVLFDRKTIFEFLDLLKSLVNR